jgi:endonuclease G
MHKAAAALPVSIALLGGLLAPAHESHAIESPTAIRAAISAAQNVPALTDAEQAWDKENNPFGEPAYTVQRPHRVLVRRGYTLSHSPIDKISDWVAYHLTKQYAQGTEPRPGDEAFQPDPKLPEGQRAERADYRGSGFDRGHQCPNADARGRGKKVVAESFLLSNMTPQEPKLNQVKWAELEDKIRGWAVEFGEVYVVTGPVFLDEAGEGIVKHRVIGKNRVAVPTHYYKIVLRRSAAGKLDALAFLIANKKMTGTFESHLTSIDEIERITGLDFFRELPDQVEDPLEADVAEVLWQ